MPRLPSAADYTPNVPGSARRLVDVPTIRQEADTAMGRTVQQLGAQFGEVMQAEADRLDETVALDALNALQNKQLELTYGDNGFAKVQGKGVIDRKITQEFPTQLQQEVDRLSGTIGGSRAKAKFQAQANNMLMSFKRGVYVHAAKETETFHQQTEDATVLTQAHAANMAAQSGNVEAVASAIAAGRASVEAAIKRRELEGPAAEAFRQEKLGTVHSNIINGLLDGGQPALAAAWLKNSRKEMTVGQADKFDARVKSEAAWAAGDSFVRDQMASGKSIAEVEAALAADAKATGDKTKYDAGMHALNTLVATRSKTYSENADKAQNEINRGMPWGRIRAKYLETMDPGTVAAFDARAKQLATGGTVKTNFDTYYTLSSMAPDEFAKVNLRSYVDKLSDGDAKHFADLQRRILNKEEKAIKDTVTLTQQLATAHNALGFGSTASGRTQRGMFDEYVVGVIRNEEKIKNRNLTDEERDVVIKRAMVKRDNAWNQFGDTRYYEVAGTDKVKTFVPAIPDADRKSLVAAFARKGKPQPTEEEIVAAYKRKHGIE